MKKRPPPKNVLHIKLASGASDQDTPSTLVQRRWDDCSVPSKKGERNMTKRAAKKNTSSSKRILRTPPPRKKAFLNTHLSHPFH
eukprot:scaffold118804_cov63-Attheya_sp.AAC.4